MPIDGTNLVAIGVALVLAVAAGILSSANLVRRQRAEAALEREKRLNGLSPLRRHQRALSGTADWEPPIAAWRAQLDDAGAHRLDTHLAGLGHTGTGFALRLPTRDGGALDVVGRRSTADNVDLLWVGDAGADRSRTQRLEREAAALADRVRQLRTLLDALPLPAWQRAHDLSLLYGNRAYAEALEAPAALTAVAAGQELAVGALGRDGLDLARRAQRTRRSVSESRNVVLRGARRLLEFHEAATPDGSIGFARDMTALEDLQADLSRLIEAQAEVLDQLHSAIAIFGPNRRLRFANQAFARLWRLDKAFLAGEPDIAEMLELLRERRRLPEVADFQSFRRAYVNAFQSVLAAEEDHLYLPDGTVVRQLIAPHPQGGLVFVFEDVTDRIALERNYNTLIAVQRETLNALSEGIAVFGPDGRLSLHNQAFAELWHLGEADLAGRPHVSDLIERSRGLHLIPHDRWPDYKRQAVLTILARTPSRARQRHSDGRVLDLSVVPLADGSNMFGTADITASQKVERALTERNLALEEADTLKSRFVANVSYELRTPLNTILGFGEILANGYFGPLNTRQAEYCAGIIEASQRLAALIEDILDLATVEAGQVELALEPVGVAALVGRVWTMARERAQLGGQEVSMDVAPDAGTVVADERRLRQVLLSLVGNAVQFTPAGSHITLSARRSGKDVLLMVGDDGPGIAGEDRDRMFLAFERGGHDGLRSAGSGAGLGLTLVKRLVELHGGAVRLEAPESGGTLVTVTLPAEGPKSS